MHFLLEQFHHYNSTVKQRSRDLRVKVFLNNGRKTKYKPVLSWVYGMGKVITRVGGAGTGGEAWWWGN